MMIEWGCLFICELYLPLQHIGKQCNGKQPKHLFLQKDHLKDEILDEKRLSLPDHLRPLRTLMAEVRKYLDLKRWDLVVFCKMKVLSRLAC